jgi:hypothetical protein
MNVFAIFYQEFQFAIEPKYNRLLNNTTTDFKEIVISLNNIVRRIITINDNLLHHIKPAGYQVYYVTSLLTLLIQRYFSGVIFPP